MPILALALVAVVLRAQIDALNQAATAAVLHMHDAAILALWEDDGVSLYPASGRSPEKGPSRQC